MNPSGVSTTPLSHASLSFNPHKEITLGGCLIQCPAHLLHKFFPGKAATLTSDPTIPQDSIKSLLTSLFWISQKQKLSNQDCNIIQKVLNTLGKLRRKGLLPVTGYQGRCTLVANYLSMIEEGPNKDALKNWLRSSERFQKTKATFSAKAQRIHKRTSCDSWEQHQQPPEKRPYYFTQHSIGTHKTAPSGFAQAIQLAYESNSPRLAEAIRLLSQSHVPQFQPPAYHASTNSPTMSKTTPRMYTWIHYEHRR